MNTNLQFIIVAGAAFLGAALANTGQWFYAKDADGVRNDFDIRKFVKSLGAAAYAATGIALAYQINQFFGVKEVFMAIGAGVAAQYANNKLRDI